MKHNTISKKQRMPIIATNLKTGHSQEFTTNKECARKLRVNPSGITHVLNGRRKQAEGYTFRYKEEYEVKESQFSKEVVKYLKEKGALVNVNTANMFDRVGRSDVECCYKGYWISLELKVGNYQPDPLQISYLQKVRDAGGFGLILRDTLQELMVLLSCIDNGIERQYKQPELPEIKVEEIEYD